MSDPRLRSAHLHAGIPRLENQVDLSWTKEAAVLAEFGLRDGMTVLELGSGPGFVTERLLEALPASRVTAVDLDPEMISFAEEHLAAIRDNRLEMLQASVLNTGLPDEAFDFALARFIFQHLAAPDMAAAEVFRMLRPGGLVAVIDVDDAVAGVVDPFPPGFAVQHKVQQLQAAYGGDRLAGRKLVRTLAAAGFCDAQLRAVTFDSDELGLEAFLPQLHPDRLRPFVAAGGLTDAEWRSYVSAYETFLGAPSPYVLQVIFVATGRKPAEALL